MPTSSWRSSLANVETRLRRSLGIAGPLRLKFDEPETALTPVVIADDATRPGCSADNRGRRWACQFDMSVAAAGNGSNTWECAHPNGVVVDSIQLTVVQAGAPFTPLLPVRFGIMLQHAGMFPGGIGYAVTTRDGQMVDPMVTSSDTAPLLTGNSGGVGVLGMPIFSGYFTAEGGMAHIPLDLWLPPNTTGAVHGSRITIGNVTVAPANIKYAGCLRGRVF